MKKNILYVTLTLLILTSCSKTWSGIEQDTSAMVENTKEVIHEATAPDPIIQDATPAKALPAVKAVDCNTVNVIKKPVAVEPTI